jgi:predicted alpha/beta-fold hydrolase
MIPVSTLHPWLERASPAVTAWRFERGGHVAFPKGAGHGRASIEEEVVAWLAER